MKIVVIILSKGGEIYGYHKQGKYFEGSDCLQPLVEDRGCKSENVQDI